MSSKSARKRSKVDDDDGVFDDNDDDDDDDDDYGAGGTTKPASTKKRKTKSFIDDAAEESGEESGGNDDDDEDEEDDEENNDYVKDGFVVDEDDDDDGAAPKKKDDLEDSDEESDDDERDDSQLKKVRKMRTTDRLDDDDLALIKEAQGNDDDDDDDAMPQQNAAQQPEKPRERVVAANEAELSRSLFYDSGEDEKAGDNNKSKGTDHVPPAKVRKAPRVEQYDEDGMDDFIEDDIGDQEIIRMADRKGGAYDDETRQEINEAQLHEASEIFGTDYLEFMQEEDENAELDDDEEELLGKNKYRERGVGVQYGGESDEEEIISDDDDDDDLFGDEDDDDDDDNAGGLSAQQKAEALRLKREKRTLAKAERRRQMQLKKSARRKAALRRAFEPVQLVENFCTERDDEIRQADIPERMFDWKAQFHGSTQDDSLNDVEEEQARWIAQRIPAISAELSIAGDSTEKERLLFLSIANALRYMHRDKLEPAFIKRYRKDYVVSVAVQNSLDSILDENSEYDRMVEARDKVNLLLDVLTKSANADESVGADAQKLTALHEELADAQKKLEETAKQENQVKAELTALSGADDDEDDELFGDDDDDENDKEEKKKEKLRLESHLMTIQSLLEARADKVSQLETRVRVVDAQNRAMNDPGPIERCTKKMRRECLWNIGDYSIYLMQLSDGRHILDLNTYLHLIKEGNDTIRKKELPLLTQPSGSAESRRRSRRFDRDFYRTCVSEGLRDVCYRFLLAPIRVGIKLEETIRTGSFDFSKTMIGEAGEVGAGNPMKWVPPTIPTNSPDEFAADLIGSGELVLLSAVSRGDPDASEAKDPLRGCRYVAAMELAYEPRVRRYLRDIYRRFAVITTAPTAKGRDEIDAFHDYYGLHLIKSKPVTEHFAVDEREAYRRQAGLSALEINELTLEMKKREKQSCLQYLNILKAESTGDVTVHVHLPLNENSDKWYTMTDELLDRDNQDLRCLLSELVKVYTPTDGDTPEWEEERMKVLHFALVTFLLPQFESEIRKDLREAAMKYGVIDASENLREIAIEGPYRPAAILHTENRFTHPTGHLPIVGVCCASDGRDSTYLASVNAKGESQDFLAIPSGVRIDSGKMREKVVLFLIQSRPSAVVVGTSGGMDSRMFQRKMVDLLAEAVKRWGNRDVQGDDEDDEAFDVRRSQFRQLQSNAYYDDDDEEEEWKCNVELLNDNVSQLFGRSVRSKKEFPEYAENLKCAISLARHAKDPLAELTYAWSVASDAGIFGTELLFLNIHPSQQLLPKTLLLRQYERVLCSVVADVGVSLNLCCSYDHLRGLLMLTPGLGPRKGANLKQMVSQMDGMISRRRDLLEKRFLGPIVYNNAVAFLRIEEFDNNSDQLYLHPLDATRLHPDVYLRNNWAIKIAFDALEREDPKSKESTAIKAIRDVMDDSGREITRLLTATEAEWRQLYGPTFNKKDWNPRVNVPSSHWRDKVDDLDLETFAAMNESNGQGRWHSHLEMIKWEFRLPFADPRNPMGPLSGDKLFRLITGETDQSIRPGKELTGKILQNGDFGSRVKLDGDIAAFISLRNMSDEHVEIADDFVSPGQVVTAIVTEVKKDHMTVDMSLKMDDFRKKPSTWERPQSLPALDIHFDMNAASRIEEINSKNRDARIEALLLSLGNKSGGDSDGIKRRGRVVRRACIHPAFVNARNDEVDRRLRDGGAAMVGEALIRPSSKSSDSLAVHWVVKEGQIKVIEVLEEGKETDASIGTILKVKNEIYGSIDELLGRYIAPMNDFVEELTNHRKFMDLLEDEVDEKMKTMKKEQPRSIPYALCWMEMHPGYASLRYVSTVTPRNHPIGISPNGYVWRETCYSSIEILLNAFKKNPQGISKSAAQSTSGMVQSIAVEKPVPKTRWGDKATIPARPPIPLSQPGWMPRPPPPISVVGQPSASSWDASMPTWGQPQPPQLPPPPSYIAPPSVPRPPPPVAAPPPRPPPPPVAVKTYVQHQQLPPPLPPMPPPAPAAFTSGPSIQSQGRGRGRTLPAWMANNS